MISCTLLALFPTISCVTRTLASNLDLKKEGEHVCILQCVLNNNMNISKEGHLVTQISERVVCVTVTGLTPRLFTQIPVSILTTITPNAYHSMTAWALPSYLITYAGAAK